MTITDGQKAGAAVTVVAVLTALALGLPLAGYSYWRVGVCSPAIDGGADPGQGVLGPGVTVVYDDEQTEPCSDTVPVIEAWEQGRGDAPFPCACSTGPTCLAADGGAVPTGITLQPGWSGACLPKACVEMAGLSSWPAQCAP